MESYLLFGSAGADVDEGIIPSDPSFAITLKSVKDKGLDIFLYGTGPV